MFPPKLLFSFSRFQPKISLKIPLEITSGIRPIVSSERPVEILREVFQGITRRIYPGVFPVMSSGNRQGHFL